MRRALRLCGVIAGFGLAAGGVFMAAFAALTWGQPGADAFLLTFFIVMAAVGLGLVRWAAPEFFQSTARRVASRLTPRDPIGLAMWTTVANGFLVALPILDRSLITLASFLIYLIVSMVMLLVSPRWWYRLTVTLIASPIVMAILMWTAEAFQPRVIGEASLAFAGLLMISWAVLPAAVLMRLLVRSWRASA